MSKPRVAIVTGNYTSPSRTSVLAQAVVDSMLQSISVDADQISLADVARHIGHARNRNEVTAEGEASLRLVESADALISASPVYRGSYTGLFKHFFDLIEQDALTDVPVILAATGGSDRHALMLEHQMRPLFSFFRAQTIPITLYATEADFADYRLANPTLLGRIDLAGKQLLRALSSRAAHAPL